MSIAFSQGCPKGEGKEGWELCTSRKAEKKIRCLSQPGFVVDRADYTIKIHANGNTKPQEPPFLHKRSDGSKTLPRLANHITHAPGKALGRAPGAHHIGNAPGNAPGLGAKPWSNCSAPGRKENHHQSDAHRRTWMSDSGRVGRVYDGIDESQDMSVPRRWNRQRKAEHYQKSEAEFNALKPHDEKFAVKSNIKFWSHLNDNGMKAGGQEKLEYVPPRRLDFLVPGTSGQMWTAGHSSLYRGKFSTVQHQQMMFSTGYRNDRNELEEWHHDTRRAFDNRLHDDSVKHNVATDKALNSANYETFRPLNTRSCTEMGADFVQR